MSFLFSTCLFLWNQPHNIGNWKFWVSSGKPKVNDSTVEISYKKGYGAQNATTFVAGADLLEADNKNEENEDEDGKDCFEFDIWRQYWYIFTESNHSKKTFQQTFSCSNSTI